MNTNPQQHNSAIKRPGKKTIVILALAALLVAAGAAGVFLPTLSAQDEETETVNKESPVVRGDLTVGISESGTASLESLSHTFSIATTVEEVLVKAGQYVEEGDVIARLNSTDIQAELTELESSYRTANIQYQQAVLQQQLTETQAQATRSETLAQSETADLEYSLSVDDQDLNVISAKSNLDSIQTQLDYYNDLLNGEDEDELREKYGLDDILDEIDTLQDQVNDVKDQIELLEESSGGCDGCSDSQYVEHTNVSVSELTQGMEGAKTSYQDYQSLYNKAVNTAVDSYNNSESPFTADDIRSATEAGTLDQLLSDEGLIGELTEYYQRWQENYALYQQYVATIAHVSSDESNSTQLANLQTELASLQAQLNAANNNWDTTASQFEAEYDEAEDKVAELETELKSAEIKYQQALINQQLNYVTAQNEKENSLSSAENAEIQYELTLLQAQSSVLSAQDNLQTIENQISETQQALEECEVKARCSGLVMNVYVTEGDEISDNATIALISNSEKAYVTVSIAQEDIGDIAIGKACNLEFGAYSDEKYTGVVDSISTSPARSGASTVSYTVSVLVDGDCSKLYEGMTAEVTFITKEVSDVLYVSNRTVFTEDGKQYVKVKREDGTIETVEVTTGFSDGTNVEILSGLNEGDVALIESTIRQ